LALPQNSGGLKIQKLYVHVVHWVPDTCVGQLVINLRLIDLPKAAAIKCLGTPGCKPMKGEQAG
jgi:hypothetical protein